MKRTFTQIIILFFCILFSYTNSFSQEWKEMLMKDAVKIENGKFTMKAYSLVSNKTDGKSLQIQFYSEAPSTGAMSRDNFILFTSMFRYEFLTQLQQKMTATVGGDTSFVYDDYSDAFVLRKEVEIKELDEIIGKADGEVNLYMTKAGLQLEVVFGGEKNRATHQWADFFKTH